MPGNLSHSFVSDFVLARGHKQRERKKERNRLIKEGPVCIYVRLSVRELSQVICDIADITMMTSLTFISDALKGGRESTSYESFVKVRRFDQQLNIVYLISRSSFVRLVSRLSELEKA